MLMPSWFLMRTENALPGVDEHQLMKANVGGADVLSLTVNSLVGEDDL